MCNDIIEESQNMAKEWFQRRCAGLEERKVFCQGCHCYRPESEVLPCQVTVTEFRCKDCRVVSCDSPTK